MIVSNARGILAARSYPTRIDLTPPRTARAATHDGVSLEQLGRWKPI
jgi:hypothetical protein